MKVVSYDESKPSITLASGEEHEADIIVAADGTFSRGYIQKETEQHRRN